MEMDGDNLNEERQTTVINLTGSVMNECGQKQNITIYVLCRQKKIFFGDLKLRS